MRRGIQSIGGWRPASCRLWPALAAGCVLAVAACGERGTPSPAANSGKPESATTKLLEAGAKVVQNREPLEGFSTYLDGFHFHSGNMKHQMEAHHYVNIVNDDLMQAMIFDGSTKDARLIGIEYIISERLFRSLPPEEQKLWHSHHYEVKSGTLVAPGLPPPAEKALMRRIAGTYGKTWHTWNNPPAPQGDPSQQVPLGIPSLMMAFTADGQLDPQLLAARDRRLNIDSATIARDRADLPAQAESTNADAWLFGEVMQLQVARLPQGELHILPVPPLPQEPAPPGKAAPPAPSPAPPKK